MTASTLVMSLFSKQSFPHEEPAIQAQPGTRSLYRLPLLHGNRNYLSPLLGFVMQSRCHPEQAFFAQPGIWASRAKRRAFCDAIIARLARFLITSPDPSALPEAPEAWQTSHRPPEHSPSRRSPES